MLFSPAQFVVFCLCLLGIKSSRLLTRETLSKLKRARKQSTNTTMSCEAWREMRAAYKKPSVSLAESGKIAFNFCRLFGEANFRMVNDDDDRDLYFKCFHEPTGAFRLKTCMQYDPDRTVDYDETYMCKVSIGYVHEGIRSDGTFEFALSSLDSEWLGQEWAIRGSLDWSDNRHMMLTDRVHLTLPSGTEESYHTMPDAEDNVKLVPFDSSTQDEVQKLAEYLAEQNKSRKDCMPVNGGLWKLNPCKDLIETSIKSLCDQFGQFNRVLYEKKDSDFRIQFLCVKPEVLHSAKLQVIFSKMIPKTRGSSEKKLSQFSHEAKWLLYDYVDVNNPTKFDIGVATDVVGVDACLHIDVEEGVVVWNKGPRRTLTYW